MINLGCGDGINDVLPVSHAPKDRIAWWQGIIDMHDEELRAISVRACVGHRDGASFVAALVNFGRRIDLVGEALTPGRLAAAACARGIATLNHETF